MKNKPFLQIIPQAAILAFLLSICTFAHSEETKSKWDSVRLYEQGTQIQFLSGQLTDENNHLHMEPVFFTFGYKINSLLNLEDHKGTFQVIFAPFFSPISSPRAAVAFGANIAVRYSYPFAKKLSIFCEGGAAPMYFGLNTEEQGTSGFNFLDQATVGFQYFFTETQAVGIGYRKIHISNLQLTDDNSGINGDAGFISFSKFF